MTGVLERLSSSRDRDPVRDFDLSLRGVSYPEPEVDDLRGRLSQWGDVLRDVRPLDPLCSLPRDGDEMRDLALDGDGLRDRTGDDDRDACREDGLDLES